MGTIRQKRATSEVWATLNPILEEGEFGYDMTEKKIKIGDGVTSWSSLPWTGGGGAGSIEVEYEFLNEEDELQGEGATEVPL